MGDNTDRLDPSATRDSNYSRKGIKEGTYPEAARSVSAKSVYNNVIDQIPWYSEFKSAGPKPSQAIQRAYEVYMRQSEFKKPYKSGGYTEMETNADPPPGYSSTAYEGPGVPDINEPIIPPGGGGAPVSVSFFVQLDKTYEYGGFCRGNTTNIRLFCQEPVYGYTATFTEAGTSVNYVSGYGTNTLILQVVAANNQFGYFRLNVEMRSVEGLQGTSGVIIREAVCEEYFVLRMQSGAVDNVTVWAMSAGAVATNIPDNAGTGVVTFPAAYADIANWLANSTLISVSALANFSTPAWVSSGIDIRNPGQYYTTSCSSSYNAFIGGSWPKVEIDTSVSSGSNGIPDCETISGETDTKHREYTAYMTVNCPAATIDSSPLWRQSYEKQESFYANDPITQIAVSANLVSKTMVFRTEAQGESYWYWQEDADYTAPPPFDLGSGNSWAYLDYEFNVYGSIDPSNPIVTYYHKFDNVETWDDNFTIKGSVTNFARTITWEDSVPRNVTAIRAGGNSVYGRHSAILYYLTEVLQVSVGNDTYQGGSIGGGLLGGWETNANLSVAYETPLLGVHAAPSFSEDYADNLDICTMSRDTDLETAIKALWNECRSDLSLADSALMTVTTSLSIRL